MVIIIPAGDLHACRLPYNMLPTNQLLNQGRYRISQSLGQNGVGLLYEAYDNVLQSKVIVKEIVVKLGKVSTVSQQETIKIAFADEAKTLKEIDHEAFLRIHDYFSEIDRHYLVMEANDESSLNDLLKKKNRPFSHSDVMNWADQLLDALNYLHSQRSPIIHRDIKPQNVKLTADGKVKLSSPGISKNLSEKINRTDANQPSAANNLHYLPLEQIWESLDSASQKVITNSYDEKSEDILKQPTDAASDIYALGATLYYLLTAQLPIDALERSIDILEGKSDPLKSPTQINPAIPIEISNVLMKALEIKRENRFSAVSIMRQVLRTSVLQIQEREAEKARADEVKEEEEALQELRLAEEKRLAVDRELVEQKARALEAERQRLEEERRLVEQKKLEIEAERKRQEELLAEKRREVEARKSQPEKLGAATVKPPFSDDDLLELDGEIAAPPPVTKPIEKTAPVISAPVAAANAPEETFAPEKTFAREEVFTENSSLFAEPQTSGGGFWKIPAAIVAVIAFGGAGFGIWYSQQSSGGNSNQPVPAQAISTSESPKPDSNTEAATTAPPTTETPANTFTAPATDPNQISAAPATAKPKPTITPTPKPKKQATPPPQTADNQKKPVTVDDLINDN